jgi:hypothetical protein
MFYSDEDEKNHHGKRNVKPVSYARLKHAPAQEEVDEDEDNGEV